MSALEINRPGSMPVTKFPGVPLVRDHMVVIYMSRTMKFTRGLQYFIREGGEGCCVGIGEREI